MLRGKPLDDSVQGHASVKFTFLVRKYNGVLWLVCPIYHHVLDAGAPVRFLMRGPGWFFHSQPMMLAWADDDQLEGEW